jgi:hypothetical protein
LPLRVDRRDERAETLRVLPRITQPNCRCSVLAALARSTGRRTAEQLFLQRRDAQAAARSAVKPIAQRSVHPRSALYRPPPLARAALSASTISPPTLTAARHWAHRPHVVRRPEPASVTAFGAAREPISPASIRNQRQVIVIWRASLPGSDRFVTAATACAKFSLIMRRSRVAARRSDRWGP